MPKSHVGRHRAPGRPNPVVALTSAVGRNVQPAVTASAALVVSSGVVAAIAVPAQAVPSSPAATTTLTSVAAVPAAPAATARITGPAVVSRTAAVSAVVRVKAVSRLNTMRPAVLRLNRPVAKAVRSNRVGYASASVLGTASRLSGIYYRWGGTTPRGFDCSGFTSYVYRKAGVRLPRTAAAQQRYARRVSSPRPGDLVFFGRPAYHVGIYAGGGRMYDSPRRGKATGLHKIWSRNVSYGRVR